MVKIGSGENGELTFLDMLSVISFIVALQNLDMNITQDDIQRTTTKLDKLLKEQIEDIHSHLTNQDTKINQIILQLEDIKNGTERDL